MPGGQVSPRAGDEATLNDRVTQVGQLVAQIPADVLGPFDGVLPSRVPRVQRAAFFVARLRGGVRRSAIC